MLTKRMLLVVGAMSAIGLSAPVTRAAGLRPLVVIDPGGTVRLQQALPCGGHLDTIKPIAGGRIDLTTEVIPADTRTPIMRLSLLRLAVFVEPFSVRHACQGLEATAEVFEAGFRLVSAVSFAGEDAGPGLVRFRIPREKFLIYTSVLDNAPVPQPETKYARPSEDVIGVVDLRAGTVEIHVALAARMQIRAGCVKNRCAIDEVLDGTRTAVVRGAFLAPGADRDGDGAPDLSDNCPLVPNPTQARIATPVLTPPPDTTVHSCADHNIGMAEGRDVCHARRVVITNDAPAKFAIGPNLVTWTGNDGIDPIVTAPQTVTVAAGADTTPPAVACTAVRPPGRGFQVSATDDCGGRIALQLGAYTLGDGEVIQIQETGRPGVRLINTIGGNIRHFQVGKGEAIVRASDAAGHVARAACR